MKIIQSSVPVQAIYVYANTIENMEIVPFTAPLRQLQYLKYWKKNISPLARFIRTNE